MSMKTDTDVLIGGKVYTMSGYESPEYLQKVASYINSKRSEIEEMEDFKRFTPDMRAVLTELNIADDYFKAKDQAEKIESELEKRDKEIYELKHDLIAAQLKAESLEKSKDELEKSNKDLQLHNVELENSLADAKAGKTSEENKEKAKKKGKE